MTILSEVESHLAALAPANLAFARAYPGERASRQQLHTVYGGAQLYKAETTQRLGELALRSLESNAPSAFDFARAVGLPFASRLNGEHAAQRELFIQDGARLKRNQPEAWLAFTVYERVRQKLAREPVEDFRIDFEDGFGARPDREEDTSAVSAARELTRALRDGLAPPFIGIRIKPLTEEWKGRAARTLELFVDTLLEAGGALPNNFVVTLPKVTIAEQARTAVRLLEVLERRHRLAEGSLRLELMIEAPQALLGPDGQSALPRLLAACEGRCTGAHLGAYDLTAACNVTAACQSMLHPLCDLARGMMTLAYAGTGIFLADGATNVIPVGPHRGATLSAAQREENRAVVHAAWQLSHRNIRHALENGYYQGWDLHPAQLPVRYAACYAFFLESFDETAARLRNFIEKAARATLVGDIFDDAATGQGLLNYFLRALNSGAIELNETSDTGLSPEELSLRSFAKILEARRARLALSPGSLPNQAPEP